MPAASDAGVSRPLLSKPPPPPPQFPGGGSGRGDLRPNKKYVCPESHSIFQPHSPNFHFFARGCGWVPPPPFPPPGGIEHMALLPTSQAPPRGGRPHRSAPDQTTASIGHTDRGSIALSQRVCTAKGVGCTAQRLRKAHPTENRELMAGVVWGRGHSVYQYRRRLWGWGRLVKQTPVLRTAPWRRFHWQRPPLSQLRSPMAPCHATLGEAEVGPSAFKPKAYAPKYALSLFSAPFAAMTISK